MINVTKSYLPPLAKYVEYLEGVWERGHLTNQGPLVNELEEKLKEYFGVKHFIFMNNGTIAIQIAIRALDLKGEIITTPFSYVATSSSIVWEQARPIFVDINPADLTIDPGKIEAAITDKTTGILATHVYGIPCAVEKIEAIAKSHNLKVIYDAAHAFGVNTLGKGIMNYGDISTISFHATKLFHTVEGGGIATNDDELAHRISYMRNFGHKGQEDFWGMGINAKNSEFHAAMGLCVFPHVKEIIAKRKEQSEQYNKLLGPVMNQLLRPEVPGKTDYNYAYYPIVLESEKRLLEVKDALNAAYIYPRRYFFPSLNTLGYIYNQSMPVAESIAARVLCLPLYHDLSADQIKMICNIIKDIIKY